MPCLPDVCLAAPSHLLRQERIGKGAEYDYNCVNIDNAPMSEVPAMVIPLPIPMLRSARLRVANSILLFVLLSCVCLPVYAQYSTRCEILNNVVVLDVALDSGKMARLLLDTGAQTTTFSRAGAERLGLISSTRPADDPNSLFTGVGRFRFIAIGPSFFKDVPFGILKLKGDLWSELHSSVGPIDGSLGLDVISRGAVGIDTVGSTVTFWQGGNLSETSIASWFSSLQIVPRVTASDAGAILEKLRAELPESTITHLAPTDHLDLWIPPDATVTIGDKTYRNPIKQAPHVAHVALREVPDSLYRVHGELDGYAFGFDLDTGSSHMTLPPGFSNIIRPAALLDTTRLNTIDASEAARGCIYRSLRFGDFEIPFPYAAASTGLSAYTRTLTAGMGIFDHCKVLLDFPGRTLSLARISPGSEAPRMALADLGLFLIETEAGKHLYIGQGSAAERLGIRSGDGIVHTQGLPPAQVDEAVKVVQADPTQAIAITVRRRGYTEPMLFEFGDMVDRSWVSPPPASAFPLLPPGYSGAKRFPRGGIYLDPLTKENRLVKPGGSVLCENGRFRVAYHDTSTKSFVLNLPKSKFQFVGSISDPGMAPFVPVGKGALWIGGLGWVVGTAGTRVELDGFSVMMR